jgi:hypothetical protein
MPVFQSPENQAGDGEIPTAQSSSPNASVHPTPDYGTLGPGSDYAKLNASAAAPPALPPSAGTRPAAASNLRRLQIVFMAGGSLFALLFVGAAHIARISGQRRNFSAGLTNSSAHDLDREKPQKQAEILLTRAVSHSAGATEEIRERAQSWRGKISLNPQLSQLTTAALNSEDENLRDSAIEVQLASYGLNRDAATVDDLLRRADSANHDDKIWALWALGLLSNRGVESDRIVLALTTKLDGTMKASDEDSRRWAVEALALAGTDAAVNPLLKAMHDDPSPLVRERAACGLAESGMLTHEQRMTAVPRLINYSDDPALDAQTHAWAFQALNEITKQRLPNDSAAWRSWYQASAGKN